MKRLATILAIAASSVTLSFAGVKTGEAAPDFKLKDLEGKEHSLSDFKGKYVVLEWMNHGCPFVKKHYESNNMQTLQKQFTGKGVVWLAINSSAPGKQGNETPDACKEACEKHQVAATACLMDPEGTVGRTFGAKTTPHMFVINPEGNVIYQGAIDSIASADAGDIAKATNYVKAALEEAMAGKPVTTAETKPYGCSVKYK